MKRTDGGAEPERRADGGTEESGATPVPSETPIDMVAEGGVSTTERYRRYADEYVSAPLRVLWSDWRSRVGITLTALFVLMGLFPYLETRFLIPYGVTIVGPPQLNAGPRYVPPFTTLAFPLGTDAFGKGVFAQVVYATPAMLKMLTAGAVFGTTLGAGIGLTAGYKGGRVDKFLMWFTDVTMTIPGLPLLIIVVAIVRPESPWVVGIILTINDWSGLARTVRSQVLTLRDAEYVEASRTMGLSTPSILTHDILPNLMPYVAVNFVGMARSVIFASVGLYFLGILPFTTLNWGVMMNLAYHTGGALYTLDTAHWLFVPMFAILLLSLGLILLAQGAEQIFNPHVRARHEATNDSADAEPSESKTGVSLPGTR
jgi:peptide/nickel transport system permease protein